MTDLPLRKKLRSVEPDVKIVIGSDDEQLVEYHHSAAVAKYSAFIDTMMASQMKEATSKEISFPDIPPKTWNVMISLLEDPIAARQCTIHAALKCLPFYDKYDFAHGRALCEHIMAVYLQCPISHDEEFGTIMDTIRLVQDLTIKSVEPQAIIALSDRLSRLTEDHFRNLAPLISENEDLMRRIDESITKEQVLSSLFPRFASQSFKHKKAISDVIDKFAPQYINVFGTATEDGTYNKVKDNEGMSCYRSDFGRDDRFVTIEKSTTDWKFTFQIGDNLTTMWECPNSVNEPIPPKTGWIAVHGAAMGNPRLMYGGTSNV